MSLPGLSSSDRYPASPAIAGLIIFGGATAIRYFRNERGETFIEAGVAEIRGRRRRACLAQLASIGVVQLLAIACIAPIMVPWPYKGPWPAYPPNILNGLCAHPLAGSDLARLCPVRERNSIVLPNGGRHDMVIGQIAQKWARPARSS
jgi:hypothetical protein